MFWKKEKSETTLEQAFENTEDRGRVNSVEVFFGMKQIAACARCKYPLHVLVFKATMAARLACPVCLSWIRERGDDGYDESSEQPAPDPVKPEAKDRPDGQPGRGGRGPTGENRIKKYFKGNGSNPKPGTNQ